MRHAQKTTGKRWIYYFCRILFISAFSFFTTAGFSSAGDFNCGDTITTRTVLINDLDCSGYSGNPALTIEKGGKLNLNGHQIVGNEEINCIEIAGDGTRVWNGAVVKCNYGIRVRGNHNKVVSMEVSDSANRGIRIDGDKNLVKDCLVTHNGKQGIKIDGGDGNKIMLNQVFNNCRDGIEIQEGDANFVFNNHVEGNGSEATCTDFGQDYKPWFYAGIDVLSVSEDNKVYYNHACGNLGCDGSDDAPCTARERNFWDENVGDGDRCISSNNWVYNTVCPECTPNPANRNN
jgi:parallel beta-helix repeat protein